MKKGKVSNLIRDLGLLQRFDTMRFRLEQFRNHSQNSEFKQLHPDVLLPPDYLIYESYQMNYDKYYNGGKEYATFLKSCLQKHIDLKNIRVLDWGCGPGRVIRHLPEIIDNGCEFYGSDYNARSIKWCSENLPGIHFNKNELSAELPYEDGFFSVIYGHSIITHLSEEQHYAWLRELMRTLKSGGILYLTAQGKNYRRKLSPTEQAKFDSGELVVRGKVKEGHRTFSAFQPLEFMQKLFRDYEVLEHLTFTPAPQAGLPQDIWIVRR